MPDTIGTFTSRLYTSREEMKSDQYHYWQSRPAHERMDAVTELTTQVFLMKGANPVVQGFRGPVVCLQRPPR